MSVLRTTNPWFVFDSDSLHLRLFFYDKFETHFIYGPIPSITAPL